MKSFYLVTFLWTLLLEASPCIRMQPIAENKTVFKPKFKKVHGHWRCIRHRSAHENCSNCAELFLNYINRDNLMMSNYLMRQEGFDLRTTLTRQF